MLPLTLWPFNSILRSSVSAAASVATLGIVKVPEPEEGQEITETHAVLIAGAAIVGAAIIYRKLK